jgi:hypothetical protein
MTAKQVQIRRDTATNLNAATPASGELGWDTTNKRLVGGDGSAAGGIKIPSAKDVQNQSFNYVAAGGTGNAITLTLSPAITAYAAGQRTAFKATATSTLAVTVNINELGTRNVKFMSGGSLASLDSTHTIISGGIYELYDDGTQVQIFGGGFGGGGGTVATQSTMETATNNTDTVTPLAMNWHPGVAKCWGSTSGGGSPTLSGSWNITSITDSGIGKLTVTIATDFSAATYAPVVTCMHSSSTEMKVASVDQSLAYAVGEFGIRCFVGDGSDGAASDPSVGYSWVCYGDQ